MLFTTPTQWLALAVALIAGWLFGLASHPGGRKWKQRYADEREVHARNRKEFDGRITDREARIKELERENTRLATAVPAAAPVTSHDRVETRAPIAQTSARPAGRSRGGWFNWTNRVGTHG